MTKKRIFSIIDILGVFLVTFVLYKVLLPFGQVCTFYTEDILSPYWPEINLSLSNPFSAFFTSAHNSWIMSMFHVLTARLLPMATGIHPQIFVQEVYFPFACFLLTLFLYCVSNNFTKYLKIRHLTFVFALALFPLIIAILRNVDLLWFFTQCCWFYAYVFMQLFGIVTFNEIQSFYIQKEKFSKRRMIVFCILVFLMLNTFEFYKFVFCSTLIIGFLLNKFFTKDRLLNKKTACFLICSLIIFAITTFIPCLGIVYDNSYFEAFTFQSFLNFFPGYLSHYWHYVIFNNLDLILLTSVLLVLIKIFGEDKLKNKRLFIYVFSVFVSILLFNFVIIWGSNINYYNCILDHSGIRFCNTTMFLCLFLSCLSYFIANTEFKKPVLVGLILTAILYSINVKKNNFDFADDVNPYKTIRQCHYILDKFFVLHSLKTPVFYNYYTGNLYQNHSLKYFIYFYKSPFKSSQYKIINITDVSYTEPNKYHHLAIRDLMIKKCKEVTGYQITEDELEKMDFQSLYKYIEN